MLDERRRRNVYGCHHHGEEGLPPVLIVGVWFWLGVLKGFWRVRAHERLCSYFKRMVQVSTLRCEHGLKGTSAVRRVGVGSEDTERVAAADCWVQWVV